MKRNIFIVIIILASLNVFSQEKTGNHSTSTKFNIGLGGGIGIYGGKTNDKNATNDTTAIDAACTIINLHFNYNILEKVSMGIAIERNGFLTNKDSSNSAYSINTGITLQYKIISKEFNKLYIDFMPAYSYFTYKDNKNTEIRIVKSNGLNLQCGIGWEHYFGNHLGMSLSSHYAFYNYKKITDANDGTPITVNYPEENFNIKLNGMNFLKLGLLYRF